MKGSYEARRVGTYGTQGTAAAANTPGARGNSVSWSDAFGNLWLFGGSDQLGSLNDLWKYDVSTSNWMWMKGSSFPDRAGIYGTKGIADAANTPGGREGSVSWSDSSGNIWLFGGYAPFDGMRNDLWKYNDATGNWTWMKGSNTSGQVGTYGTQGTAAAANIPGARYHSSGSKGPENILYLFGGYGYAASSSRGPLNDLWAIYPDAGVADVQNWLLYNN